MNAYGYEHPMLNALEAWMGAVDAYIDNGGELPSDDQRAHLFLTCDALHSALAEVPYTTREAFPIRRNLIGLTAQFLFMDYTDSDTDAPCDMEYDICRLVELIDPNFHIDPRSEVQPAYVMRAVFNPPEEE